MKNYVIPKFERILNGKLSNYLKSSVEAFSFTTGIPVTFFSNTGDELEIFGSENKICTMFNFYNDKNNSCRENIISSISFSAMLGEPYIFLCKSGLANISISMIVNGKNEGCFIAGPILMGNLRDSTVKKFIKLNNLPEGSAKWLPCALKAIPQYTPNEINQLALLLYNCVLAATGDYKDYSKLRTAYEEQNILYDGIQSAKESRLDLNYPYSLEEQLLDAILSGELSKAELIFNDFLKKVSILESGDLSLIKTKILWLFSMITRKITSFEQLPNTSDESVFDILFKINETTSYDKLKTTCNRIIKKVTNNILSATYNGNSPVIINALKYINLHFREKITLLDIENELHVNPSYFSTLFKHEVGETFTSYLNSIRIKYACNLLENSNMNILEIALAAGFEDQSYFTKVFSKSIGKTPKKYRLDSFK